MNRPEADRSPQERLDEALVEYMERLDRGEPVDRASFLADFPDLRAELNAYFDACDRVDRLAGSDSRDPDGETFRLRRTPPPGRFTFPCAFGEYELLEELGRGGMGVIYKARQRGLDRLVALKMILDGPLADPVDVQRFRNEAEAIARLDHPHIVPVYDVGEHDGRQFFTMKLVEGGTLSQRMAKGEWRGASKEDQKRTAMLMVQVARAVHHAHKRGILHRDLKPANILLADRARSSVQDQNAPDAPDPDGPGPNSPGPGARVLVPLVSDFGLARRIHAGHELTASDRTVGTPSYMAPEQVAGRRDLMTTATDVWGLGAVLYALLSGRPPFQADSAVETMRQVQEQEPSPPRAANPAVDRDLEVICLKCLEKEPARRYGSAEDFALDLERWLGGESIQARRAGTGERLLRWARRRPALAALLLVSGVAALLVVGLAVGASYNAELNVKNEELRKARQAEEEQRKKAEDALRGEAQQRNLATAAAADTERYLYLHRVALADSEWRHGNVDEARDGLAQCPTEQRRWEWHFLERVVRVNATVLEGLRSVPRGLAYSTATERVLCLGSAGEVALWDTRSAALVRHFRHDIDVLGAAVSPDGKRVATAGADRQIRVWDVDEAEPRFTLKGHPSLVRGLAFSPDGRFLASGGGDAAVRVWDLTTGQESHRLTRNRPGVVSHLEWSQTGDVVAVGADRFVSTFDAKTGALHKSWALPTKLSCMALSPDARLVATCVREDRIDLWDSKTAEGVKTLVSSSRRIAAAVFSPDGKSLAAAGMDRSIQLWDLDAGTPFQTLHGAFQIVGHLAFSPKGDRLASTGFGSAIKVWDLEANRHYRTFAGHQGVVSAVAFHPSGDTLASAGQDGTVRLWGRRDGRTLFQLAAHQGRAHALAFRRDAAGLATAGADGTVKLWDHENGRLIRTLADPPQPARVLAFHPTSAILAGRGDDGLVRLWDADSGRLVRSFVCAPVLLPALAFSPDGRWLASSDGMQGVRVWDSASGETIALLKGHARDVVALAFSPDGRQLATSSRDKTIRLWELPSGRSVRTISTSTRMLGQCISYHPEGDRLASGNSVGGITLWDTKTGAPALTLRGPYLTAVLGLSFSPDGRTLASATDKGEVHLWESVAEERGRR